MKVLLVNNFHYLRGGAERAYFDLGKLLEEKGAEVAYFSTINPRNRPSQFSSYFVRDYDLGGKYGFFRQIKIALRIIYNFEAARKMKKILKDFQPDIVHLHNIYHHLSPSVLKVLKKYDIPVVMSLHDYKLVCPDYKMFRQGKICDKCLGGKFYNCLRYRCVAGSFLKSFVLTLEAYIHNKILKTYDRVNLFISPSDYLREVFVRAGFSRERIRVLPHFLFPEEWQKKKIGSGEDYFLYFGRLSSEKGVEILIKAWIRTADLKLKIAGEGKQKKKLEEMVRKNNLEDRVEFLGFKKGEELKEIIQRAKAVVFPFVWAEVFGYTLLESLSLGTPVIASRAGAAPEIITEGENGLLFQTGDPKDLKNKLLKLNKKSNSSFFGNISLSSEYTPEKYASKILPWYQELISGKNL